MSQKCNTIAIVFRVLSDCLLDHSILEEFMSMVPTKNSETLLDALEKAANTELNTQRALQGESGITTWQQEIKRRLASGAKDRIR
jgi:hypothetical protein